MRRRDASVSGRGDGVWVAPDAIDASPNARQTVYGRESSHTGFGFVMSFLFVFIVRGLGGAATLCGLALFVECAVEVPVMRAADGLLAQHGSKTLVVVVLLLYAARCCGYLRGNQPVCRVHSAMTQPCWLRRAVRKAP